MEEGEIRVEPSRRGLLGERREFGDDCVVGRKKMEIMREEESFRRKLQTMVSLNNW